MSEKENDRVEEEKDVHEEQKNDNENVPFWKKIIRLAGWK